MPKIVDHDKQKEKLAEATLRIIKRDGMEQATVRNIAKEANMSVGSLRHYFSTQSELYAFTMNLVSERVNNRISQMDFNGPPLEVMTNVLKEVVPLKPETRLEMEVWLAFTARALVDPFLKPLSERVYIELKEGITRIIDGLLLLNLGKPDMNKDLEIERLYALVDGLAMHSILHPDKISAEMVELVIAHHLQTLCK
ncbi:TetR/AcrR family transcriptional regulator [Fredinandcohnia humi]